MRIEKIELIGFKSFADKTTFALHPGITCIVGPNGCGKSNIVDAFRFALGEGNFRELRVLNLPEVIFAGTVSRKPLSLAEITLWFDNSSEKLPVPYTEVSIKRRTFRDGQSEFLINNQTGRLKDIRGLFLDTGLSCESLSIIGQGRVDEILSSRPEERRAVFEEVAGIHKYKVRKLEVERKLILAEQNLLRISDLKVEVGEQTQQLEVQAQKAREYQEIQKRVRALELLVFQKQVRNLSNQKEESGRRLEEHQQKTKQHEEIKADLKREGKTLEEALERTLANLEDLKGRLEGCQRSLLIEHERALFEERNKIRDLAEEERFNQYEIKRIKETLGALALRRTEIEKRLSEWGEADLEQLSEFQPVVKVGLQLVKQLNELTQLWCGKLGIPLRLKDEDPVLPLFKAELNKIISDEGALKDNLKFKEGEIGKIAGRLYELKQALSNMEKEPRPQESEEINKLYAGKVALLTKLDEIKKQREQRVQALEKLESPPEGGSGGVGEMVREEIILAKIQGELEQIEDRLQGDYGISFVELLSQTYEVPPASRGKKEVGELKARLRELEPVNLLAIEEYERVKERRDFIELQHADLQSARESLRTLIVDLDAKAREDFQLTMERVTKNFQEVFASLFIGGEARIEMEKDKDLLEAGIEISVCPSGRKWLNLSLLSGGERSLTAIAILFSLIKTKPSPLCILDEVDAALDDANIGRFANFLKEYANQTQIIVITHNKRTMEVADTIYGITMEEPGVSKVVSMRLEKV